MARILVVYYSRAERQRPAVEDHVYCFARYSGHQVLHLNLGFPWVPDVFRRLQYDLIIFDTTLLWHRMVPDLFSAACARGAFLRAYAVPKIMFPQDEHKRGADLVAFIERFGVTQVFSCARESEWPVLYPGVDQSRVKFHTVLPGYISEELLRRVERLQSETIDRTIDIGYRVKHPLPANGSHGQLKPLLGQVVAPAADVRNLRTDISSRVEDTLYGDDWYRFLLRCKYTLGVEGGASVLDTDGTIEACVLAYLKEHATAAYAEVEDACFAGKDGSVSYYAISPRHLEACVTRTCQVLIEGEYNGILLAGAHYIALKRDFSNLNAVLDEVESDDARAGIVERAYKDVVASDRWTYRELVREVLDAVWGGIKPETPHGGFDVRVAAAFDGVMSMALRVAHWTRRAVAAMLGPDLVARLVARVKVWLGEKG